MQDVETPWQTMERIGLGIKACVRTPVPPVKNSEPVPELRQSLHAHAEMNTLAFELSLTPLARAYRRLRTATTGKQERAARSAIRRATRQQMVRTMTHNSPELKQRPQIAKRVAAEVVRAQMSTHHA